MEIEMQRRSFLGFTMAAGVTVHAAEAPFLVATVPAQIPTINVLPNQDAADVTCTFVRLRFFLPWKPTLNRIGNSFWTIRLRHSERRIGSLTVSTSLVNTFGETPSKKEVLPYVKAAALEQLRNSDPQAQGGIEDLVAGPSEFLFRRKLTISEDGSDVHHVWYAAGTWRTYFLLWLSAEGPADSLWADGDTIVRSREWTAES